MIRNPRSSMNVVIHVSLMESRLPRVPPLKINIPPEYPDESPSILDLRAEYGNCKHSNGEIEHHWWNMRHYQACTFFVGSSGFLNSIARTLKSRMLHLPHRFTVLEMLRCWEMSVREVCNPQFKANAPARKQISESLARAFR